MMVAAVTTGRSTFTLLLSMGVTTMKMIKRTSITSTMGVTLMSELTFLPSSRFAIAIMFAPYWTWFSGLASHGSRRSCAGWKQTLRTRRTHHGLAVRLFDEVVHQFRRAVVHLDVERLNLVPEVVEEHHGRDGDEQTERGCYESFRNTAGHSADTGCLGARDRTEGVQNADHGAEQADKGGRGADGGQTAEALLQLRMNNSFRTLKRALGALHLLFGDGATRTEGTKLSETGGDNLGEVRLLALVGNLDRLVQTAFLEGVGHTRGKLARLTTCCREVDRPVNDHGQRPDRHDEQNDNDSLGQDAHIAPEFHGAEADRGRRTTGRVLKEHGERGEGNVGGLCEMSENHGLLPPVKDCERLLEGAGRTVNGYGARRSDDNRGCRREKYRTVGIHPMLTGSDGSVQSNGAMNHGWG